MDAWLQRQRAAAAAQAAGIERRGMRRELRAEDEFYASG